MSISGQWEGELNGKVGHFPFTHVEFIDGVDSGIEEQGWKVLLKIRSHSDYAIQKWHMCLMYHIVQRGP